VTTLPERFGRPPVRVDGFLPLRGYALLGDGRCCVLVGSDGAVDWWPLPAMDSAPMFGALLDPDRGGRLVLCPVDDFEVSRCYVDGGAVLATVFRTATGTVRVTDALTLGAGSLLPWTELARRVEVIDGEVRMRWEVAPGDRFAGNAAWARTFGGVPLISAGGQQLALVLDQVGAPVQAEGGFRAEFTARAGTPGLLAVVATDAEPTPVPSVGAVTRRIAETTDHWARWRQLVEYDGPWAEAVARSAQVHKQLTLAATGGLQAAATTSLPERIGGSRNFDYRFSWVRDTGFALNALTSIGLRGEVHSVLSYLLRAVASTAPDVRVFYAMSGGEASPDMNPVRLWSGYRDTGPVQVGNSAAGQRQLGVYGDLLEAIHRYAAHGNVLDGGTGRLVAQVADRVCEQWREDDAGLWELGKQRQYTSSKVGCWAALYRAVKAVEDGQMPAGGVDRWRAAAEEIHSYVDDACWSPTKNSYTFYAGTDELDCATLLVARTGFCSGDDPRLHGTIDAIRRELSAGGPLLYRYSGMGDEEGAFVACSFWLVEALSVAGRLDEAREVMDAAVERANDVGLLSEEIDPDSGALLGNMPQMLSHLALISAATRYQQAITRG
jgi:GH15 family glucan-1,4-alpha-glucosidase